MRRSLREQPNQLQKSGFFTFTNLSTERRRRARGGRRSGIGPVIGVASRHSRVTFGSLRSPILPESIDAQTRREEGSSCRTLLLRKVWSIRLRVLELLAVLIQSPRPVGFFQELEALVVEVVEVFLLLQVLIRGTVIPRSEEDIPDRERFHEV